MQFGIWLPVYGGWLRARGFDTDPRVVDSVALAIQAEREGYDCVYASENFLNCIHGVAHDVDDAWMTLSAVAARTTRLGLVGGLKPGFRPPLVAAQMIATLDRLSGGRVAVNMVCGWWQEEFRRAGVDWRAHDDKYVLAADYLATLGRLWSGDATEREAPRKRLAGTDMPPVWVSGHSDSALTFAADIADVLFLNGMPLSELRSIMARLAEFNRKGRHIRIAINAFVILGRSDAEAQQTRANLLARGRGDLIDFYKAEIARSGSSAWTTLSDEDFIDANGGFATALVGTADTITARLRDYQHAGVDLVLCQFADMQVDCTRFANEVMRNLYGFPSHGISDKEGVSA